MPDFSIADVFTTAGLAALAQVIMIDLMLAGDNVVVLGTLAAGLPPKERKRVLAIGVGIALVCLVSFAFLATQLLHVVGLLFAGGLLLLWVGWKLFREIYPAPVAEPIDDPDTPEIEGGKPSDQVGCVRVLTLQDGARIRERLLEMSDLGCHYSYSILESPLPVANYRATLRLRRITDGNRTLADWSASFDPDPPEKQAATEDFVRKAVFQGGFDALKKHFGG